MSDQYDWPGLSRRDLHIHTPYCNHAVGVMEDYVRAALARGLLEIGFLEHVEAGIQYHHRTWLTPDLLETYWEEGQALRRKYQDRIVVSLGLEAGINPECVEDLRALIGRHHWDRIGLSYHFVREETAGTHLNICSGRDPNLVRLKELDPLSLVRHYYQTLLTHLPLFAPDMLCHLDVVRRNLPDRSDEAEIRALIRQVLAEMARLAVTLEVNTAGYRYTGELFPARWILQEAVRLNLPLALCSDSHAPDQVAGFFDRALADLKLAGEP